MSRANHPLLELVLTQPMPSEGAVYGVEAELGAYSKKPFYLSEIVLLSRSEIVRLVGEPPKTLGAHTTLARVSQDDFVLITKRVHESIGGTAIGNRQCFGR